MLSLLTPASAAPCSSRRSPRPPPRARNILEPQLFGRRLGLSPLVVFMSLLFWGWVWGPVGMLLSVPLTVIARIVFDNSRDLRWIAMLLASEPPGAREDDGE